MQDVQNIPNPDVDSLEIGKGDSDDFGSHSDVVNDPRSGRDTDVERPVEDIPLPPNEKPAVPVEEPPEEREKPPIDEGGNARQRLV